MNIKIDHVQSLKDMIKSCFTYGGADRTSHNFKTYIKPYEIKVGTDLFNETYETYLTYLKESFEIKHGVYTDPEGCTYNELVLKN